MKYLSNAYLIIYAELRLLVYDATIFLQELKTAFVAKDNKAATEMLGKVVSWIIALGAIFIIYGTIKGLTR